MKRRWLALLLAAGTVLSAMPGALAAEPETARVVLEAEQPDADGCFTMEMRIYDATFNAFQFVLWYDEDTVIPVDGSGRETDSFSAFAQKEDTGWMATIGTSIDPEQDLIDFTGYVTPGQSVAVDGEGRTGVATVGESGLTLFTFRFKKVGTEPVVLKLAAQGGDTPWQPYLPEGGAVLDAGISAPLTLELVFPEDTGESGTVEVTRPEEGGQTDKPDQPVRPEKTVDDLLDQAIFLEIGSHAAVVGGGVTAIYPGERAVTAYAHDNRTFVPVRFVAERLGADVTWEGDTQTVVVQKDGHTIRMAVGSLTYTLDGETRTLDVPAEYMASTGGNSRTMVPVRFVTEALGYQVEWDRSRNLVVIVPPDSGWDPAGTVEGDTMDEAVRLLTMYSAFV